jgi:N-acetylmuramoyl-L-alanine amidase
MFTKPDRAVDRVFLHCSASDRPEHDNVDTMRDWHLARGWSDVGYHFFIRKDGTVEDGRSVELTPAAQGGNNTGTIAICLHGLAEENFTSDQFRSLIDLCKEISISYANLITFHGHCEVSAKACPVFPYKAVLGLDGHGEMAFTASDRPDGDVPPSQSPAVGDIPSRPTLRLGDRNGDVQILQQLLVKAGHELVPDGIFGQVSATAVRAFQTTNGLVADAIVGPATWKALQA